MTGVAVAAAAAQSESAPPSPQALRPDLQELAVRLRKAHGIDPQAPAIDSFRATLRLEPRQGKDSITVEVRVDFKAPKALRCTAMEKGVRAERGFDPETGPWAISGDQVLKLQGAEMEQDRDRVQRELRLCRQLLRFLDPERLVASLQAPSEVRKADLEITKQYAFHGCSVVEGAVESFPSYSMEPGQRVHVTLFVHPDTDQLLAVSAKSIDAAGKPADPGELIVLEDYVDTQGLRLPRRLKMYRLQGAGCEPLQTVHVVAIDLRYEFAPDHFARPRSAAESGGRKPP